MSPYLKKDVPSAGSAAPEADVPLLTDRLGFPPLDFDTTVPMFDTLTPTSGLADLDIPSVQVPASPVPAKKEPAQVQTVAPVAPIRTVAAAPVVPTVPTARQAPPIAPTTAAPVARTPTVAAFSETNVDDILNMASVGLPETLAPTAPKPSPSTAVSQPSDEAIRALETRLAADLHQHLNERILPGLQQQLGASLHASIDQLLREQLAQLQILTRKTIDEVVHQELERLRHATNLFSTEPNSRTER